RRPNRPAVRPRAQTGKLGDEVAFRRELLKRVQSAPARAGVLSAIRPRFAWSGAAPRRALLSLRRRDRGLPLVGLPSPPWSVEARWPRFAFRQRGGTAGGTPPLDLGLAACGNSVAAATRRSGKAGSPFLRPLLECSSVGRESSSVLRTGIEPRCGSRPPCVLANHPVSPLPESRSCPQSPASRRRWSRSRCG